MHRERLARYDLTGPENQAALDAGLAGGEWHRTPVPRKRMKELMRRADAPAAAVPTDSGPLRSPLAESVPAVRQLQEQVPMARERLRRVIGPQDPEGEDGPHDPAGRHGSRT